MAAHPHNLLSRLFQFAATVVGCTAVLACGGDKISGPVPVASVGVVIASPSVVVGTSTQATATIRDSDGGVLNGRSIAWSSSDTEVASVSAAGVVTAHGSGTAQIRATSEGKEGSATVSVTPVPIAAITVVIADPSMQVGGTRQASAVAKDASGNVLTGRPIVWATDNAEVATVSTQGLVTGLKAGTATITATSEGKSGGQTVTVSAVVPQVRQRSLAMGSYHACGIGVDGNTYCWGFGYNGQLGRRIPNSDAARPITGDHKFSALSAAVNTTYAVKADGGLYCWGGIPCDPTAGNTIDEFNGPAVPDAKRMETSRAIEVIGQGSPVGGGYEPMCAVGMGNVAYCWGRNGNGQLGLGFTSSDTVLVPDRPVVGSHAFADIAAGLGHTCALTITGSAYCWGAGTYGALGDGSGTNSSEPRAVAGNPVFKMIGVGAFFACGLTSDGKVYCWGGNDLSQLGTTTGNCLSGSFPCSATPVAVTGGYVFESLAVGNNRACGVTAAGDVYCWGSGFGPTPTRFRSVLAGEPGGVPFKIVALGFRDICAISTSGDAWCRYSGAEPVPVPGGVKFRTP